MDNYQKSIDDWMLATFGEMISGDKEERNWRFLEEAIELVQACGGNAGDAHQLVDYVFNRPVGEKHQEVGGVAVTLNALCSAHGLDRQECEEAELKQIWEKKYAIRRKQATKPLSNSPLPA